MRLTSYSDYALRCLIYLAVQEQSENLVNIQDIADSYQISKNHLTKIVHQLATLGYIESVRGRNGGIRLAKKPKSINLGQVVRQTEADFSIVTCFEQIDREVFTKPSTSKKFPIAATTINQAINQCKIAPTCKLKSIFFEATQSFLRVLDQYTLYDITDTQQQLQKLFGLYV